MTTRHSPDHPLWQEVEGPQSLAEWSDWSESFEKRIRPKLQKIAAELGITEMEVRRSVMDFRDDYGGHPALLLEIADGAQIKNDLRIVAKRANALAKTIENMQLGALTVLIQADGGSRTFDDAEPSSLVGVSRSKFSGSEKQRRRDGRWFIRLDALSTLAETRANWVESLIERGGRKDFGTRLFGNPMEDLAEACWRFVTSHGCEKRAVALSLMQAAIIASGHEVKKGTGDKALRRIVQTHPFSGSV